MLPLKNFKGKKHRNKVLQLFLVQVARPRALISVMAKKVLLENTPKLRSQTNRT